MTARKCAWYFSMAKHSPKAQNENKNGNEIITKKKKRKWKKDRKASASDRRPAILLSSVSRTYLIFSFQPVRFSSTGKYVYVCVCACRIKKPTRSAWTERQHNLLWPGKGPSWRKIRSLFLRRVRSYAVHRSNEEQRVVNEQKFMFMNHEYFKRLTEIPHWNISNKNSNRRRSACAPSFRTCANW